MIHHGATKKPKECLQYGRLFFGGPPKWILGFFLVSFQTNPKWSTLKSTHPHSTSCHLLRSNRVGLLLYVALSSASQCCYQCCCSAIASAVARFSCIDEAFVSSPLAFEIQVSSKTLLRPGPPTRGKVRLNGKSSFPEIVL